MSGLKRKLPLKKQAIVSARKTNGYIHMAFFISVRENEKNDYYSFCWCKEHY